MLTQPKLSSLPTVKSLVLKFYFENVYNESNYSDRKLGKKFSKHSYLTMKQSVLNI